MIFFRERQSPKEVAKKSESSTKPNILENNTTKLSLDTEFDLLSLNKPSNNTTTSGVTPEPTTSSAVTDLLGLGGKLVMFIK